LGENGEHHIDNLTLDDVINITSDDNVLEILGDNEEDSVSQVDTTGWSKDSSSNHDGINEYVYINDAGDSLTLKIDENIDNTGL